MTGEVKCGFDLGWREIHKRVEMLYLYFNIKNLKEQNCKNGFVFHYIFFRQMTSRYIANLSIQFVMKFSHT